VVVVTEPAEKHVSVLGALAKGMSVTFRHMFRRKVTIQFPEERRQKPRRAHGRHALNRYPDGMEKCIGCELCAGVCPARCIYVRGADNPPDAPVSPGERFGFVYELNMLRCIYCGMCVEACPTEAITMTQMFEFSMTSRLEGIYTKEHLLVEPNGKAKAKPHRGPRQLGLDVPDGWMRATSPNGAAAFDGVVAWSGEAGRGVAPPELDQERKDMRRRDLEALERGEDPAAPTGAGHGGGHH
jgi:NADH-quinone oxidoreductase subunit I